jgi:protein O-GlcNAc transferase
VSDPVQARFEQAFGLHRAGQLAEADALYRELLEAAPDHFDALHFRGVLMHQCGRQAEALELIRRALALDPGRPAALANLGLVLQALGLQADAIESYDRALSINPEAADTWMNRGDALRELKRYEEAVQCYDRALGIQRGNAEAHLRRGHALFGLRRLEEALAGFDRALSVDPARFDALLMRGVVLLEMRMLESAVASLDQALALRPGDVVALSNRGGALTELKRPAEALIVLDRALQEDAGAVFALFNRGIALRDLKRPEEAAATFARLLDVDADFPWAPGYLLNSRLQCCDWTAYAKTAASVEAAVGAGRQADTPFPFLSVSNSASAQLQCARTWVADKCPRAHEPVWKGERYKHDRIRLAYLSADYSEHAVSYLIAELFEIHDRSQFEVIGVSFGPDSRSPMRERLKRGFDRFIDARDRSDLEVARELASLEVDIAIDLNGFTQGNRAVVFAHRGAPTQVNYLGYPGTMGADYIDYLIADPHLIPSGQEGFYAEKVVRLPDAYQVNDRTRAIASPALTREQAGLPPEGFVFCCFNNNFKITPPMFDIWMRLLAQVPGSVLWLLEDNAVAVRNLRAEAQSRGVAAERIVFAGRAPVADHLARHALADLFLDTLPYNAHTTASDALWAGLPLVTCMGATFAARVAGSLLHASGMPELVTHSLADYEALALRLATDPVRHREASAKLALNRGTCALFDTDRYRRHIEAAFVRMHQRSQRGLPPEGFDVDRIA